MQFVYLHLKEEYLKDWYVRVNSYTDIYSYIQILTEMTAKHADDSEPDRMADTGPRPSRPVLFRHLLGPIDVVRCLPRCVPHPEFPLHSKPTSSQLTTTHQNRRRRRPPETDVHAPDQLRLIRLPLAPALVLPEPIDPAGTRVPIPIPKWGDQARRPARPDPSIHRVDTEGGLVRRHEAESGRVHPPVTAMRHSRLPGRRGFDNGDAGPERASVPRSRSSRSHSAGPRPRP